jgi:predicted transcriptional regulator
VCNRDRCEWHNGAIGAGIAKGHGSQSARFAKHRGEISHSSQAELLDELAAQNQELLTTLDQLNTQRIELEKINDELEETNRGVVALYDELDTVQRVGRVVASKLDLTALLQAITDSTVEVSGAECGGFFRKEPQSANFICQTVAGPLGSPCRIAPLSISTN